MLLSMDRDSGRWDVAPPKIEGFPHEDGFYWYYKMGEKMPSLVQVGTYKGERAIKDGSGVQRYWLSGEFFVGPIHPPYATPDELASPSEKDRRKAHDNRRTIDEGQGVVIGKLLGKEENETNSTTT